MKKQKIFMKLIAFLSLLVVTNADTSEFSTKLDKSINLLWNYNSTHITFEIQALSNPSTGVIFGFQNPLAPTTYDALLAWIDETGVGFFGNVKVTQAGTNYTYTVNAKQNLLPLNSSYTKGYQVFRGIRKIKLPSCDSQSTDNIDIGLGEINVAYSIENPVDLMAQTATIQKLNNQKIQILSPQASISCYQPEPILTFNSAPTMNYDKYLDLMDQGNYRFYWSIKNGTLLGEVHARTIGWVGFGLSPDGSMINSNVMVFWINSDGSANFSERYAILSPDAKFPQVKLTPQQNWKYLNSFQKNGYTTVKFSRPIVLCGEKELSIQVLITDVFLYWRNSLKN